MTGLHEWRMDIRGEVREGKGESQRPERESKGREKVKKERQEKETINLRRNKMDTGGFKTLY